MKQYYDRSFHSPSSAVYGQKYHEPLVDAALCADPLPFLCYDPPGGHGDGSVCGDGYVEILPIG
jgi:hypothetical protein